MTTKPKPKLPEVDSERVVELTEKIKPLLDGYSGHELSHAFLLLLFKLGVMIGQQSTPIIVLHEGAADMPEAGVAEKKGKKNGKAYVN